MGKFNLLFFILILLFTGVCYLSTNDLVCSAIVLISSLLYFFTIARLKISRYLVVSKKYHSCYTFINSFLISLSIKPSLISAFNAVKLNMDRDYISIYNGIVSLNDTEKLNYLKRYYKFDVFNLFLSIVKIFLEQGGDIFDLSRYLSNELRRSEDYLIKAESITRRKVVDFSLLWLFTLVILVVLKFALTQFYSLIANLLFFKITIVALFLVILLSIHILIVKATNIDIRGFKDA